MGRLDRLRSAWRQQFNAQANDIAPMSSVRAQRQHRRQAHMSDWRVTAEGLVFPARYTPRPDAGHGGDVLEKGRIPAPHMLRAAAIKFLF